METEDSVKSVKVRLIGIPLVSFTIALIDFFSSNFYKSESFLACWAVSSIYTLIIWQCCLFILIKSRSYFPEFSQTCKRLIFLACSVIVFLTFFTLGTQYLMMLLMHNESLFFLHPFVQNIIPTTIILLIYESVYFYNSWKSYLLKTESLIHENVKSQLDALKSQLDPHFLFNSLNTLASLVGEKNIPAQTFLEQLADVYRYVLLNREKNMVSMKDEMNFLDAYVYLNKIRFRENIQVEKSISSTAMQKNIAPLSLQLLMENALKHNAATRDSPLKIHIRETSDGYIIMENNIQEKKTLDKSTKLGLQNIVNRYKLLSTKEVLITHADGNFAVAIPLLSA